MCSDNQFCRDPNFQIFHSCIQSFIHSFIHLLINPFIHSFFHSDDLLDDIENWRLLSDETVQKFPNSPSLLYGAHHFLRLFVHLPKLLSLLTDINSVKMNAILFHVEGILDYIDDNADYFLAEDFANLAHVMEELNANAARNKLH